MKDYARGTHERVGKSSGRKSYVAVLLASVVRFEEKSA